MGALPECCSLYSAPGDDNGISEVPGDLHNWMGDIVTSHLPLGGAEALRGAWAHCRPHLRREAEASRLQTLPCDFPSTQIFI